MVKIPITEIIQFLVKGVNELIFNEIQTIFSKNEAFFILVQYSEGGIHVRTCLCAAWG